MTSYTNHVTSKNYITNYISTYNYHNNKDTAVQSIRTVTKSNIP